MNRSTPSKTTIVGLELVQRPGYHEQWRRNYAVDLQPEKLHGNPQFKGLLGFAANLDDAAVIPNGWDASRYSFTLRTRTEGMAGSIIYTEVTGFTDSFVDPATVEDSPMLFFPNSTTMWRETHERTPDGLRTHLQVVGHDHVHANINFAGMYNNEQFYKLRPEDVYAGMRLSSISVREDVLDMRTILDARPIASKRAHLVPSIYLDSIISNYRRALSDTSGIAQPYNEEDILECARGYVQENMLRNHPFFKLLDHLNDGMVKNTFTWADLKAMQADIWDVTVVVPLGLEADKPKYKDWFDNDIVTHQAWAVAMGVPAIMGLFGINRVDFDVTNIVDEKDEKADPMEQVSVSVSSIYDGALGGADMSLVIGAFKRAVVHHLVPALSYDGQVGFRMHVSSALSGETIIELQFGDHDTERFVVPTFADALMSPIITRTHQIHQTLIRDIEAVVHFAAEQGDTGDMRMFGCI